MIRYAVATLFIIAVASATDFLQCDNVSPPTALRVKNCDKLPCYFPRGKDILAQMDFTTEIAATKLKPQVRVKALDIWVDYPIGYDDACPHLTVGKCPMAAGDSATYDIQIPVLSSYPKIAVFVEVTLKNEDDKPISCFQIAGQVVDALFHSQRAHSHF